MENDGSVRTPLKNMSDGNAAKLGKETPLDLSKVNDLLANVDNRLSGGLHGAFYESGSRLESNTRHGQLEALFDLKSQLSDVQASLAKQAQRAEAEEDKKTGGTGKPSGSMINTVKTIVQTQMSDKLRDITIRLDRIKDSIKKDRETHDTQFKALEVKVKKLELQDKAEKGSDAKMKALEKKVKQLEENNPTPAAQAKQAQQLDNAVSGFNKARLDALEDCKTAHAARIQKLETWRVTHGQAHIGINSRIELMYLKPELKDERMLTISQRGLRGNFRRW